jgi:hypothetical protein
MVLYASRRTLRHLRILFLDKTFKAYSCALTPRLFRHSESTFISWKENYRIAFGILDSSTTCRQFSYQSGDNAAVEIESATETSNEDLLVAEKEATLGNLLDRTPTRVSTEDYLIALRALAASKLPDAPLRAERWIYRLEQHAANISTESNVSKTMNFFGNSSVKGVVIPTSECYQRVIEAWGGAINEDAARVVTRAERWLWKNIDSTSLLARPDTACFNAFLEVCTKGRALKNTQSGSNLIREHAQKAENVVRYMVAMRRKEGPECKVAPTIESFNLVLRGWTRCRKSIDISERTMDALNLLEQYQLSVDPNVRPDSKSYGMAMDAINVRAKLKVKLTRGPLGKTNRNNPSENGIEEIQLLTNMIEFLHEKKESGDTHLAPNTFSYNILLSCWANAAFLHEHAPSETEKVLRQMTLFKEQGLDGMEPDNISYLMVMRAWANSNRPNRGHRATWLLSKQWSDYRFNGNENLKPTVESYNTIIRVWIGLMEPLQAEKLLSELVLHGDEDKTGKLRPNSESFSLVIRAWLAVAELGSDAALITAAKWIFLVEEREKAESGILSSSELFTLFFGAARKCAKSSVKILDTTMEVFNKLKNSRHTIDCLHYSRLLQVGLQVLSKQDSSALRNSFIEHVLSDCKQAGLVSSPLLYAISNGPIYPNGWTVDESQRVLAENFPQWPLPAAWTRNVKPDNMLPKESDRWRRDFTIGHHGLSQSVKSV